MLSVIALTRSLMFTTAVKCAIAITSQVFWQFVFNEYTTRDKMDFLTVVGLVLILYGLYKNLMENSMEIKSE